MQPLSGVRVLDLTWHVAGPYATKLLADWGADVIKVERPGSGDPARSYGPFPGDEPHLERSGTFLHLNTNKRSITVNWKAEAGKQVILQLARWADVVVENLAPGVLGRAGLDYAALRQVNPSLVMGSISNFGQTGPHRDREATEFTLAARAGLTFITGVEDREPLKSVDHLQEYQAGAMAATAVMGALLHRRVTGAGQHIDVSILEVAADSADRRTTLLLGYAYTGLWATREPLLAGALPLGTFPCQDGYAMLVVSPQPRWSRFMQVLGRPDLLESPELKDPGFWTRPEAKDLVDGLMYPWLVEHTKQEVMERAQAHRIASSPVNTTVEVLADKHWRARGYWAVAGHPEAGSLPYTGPSFRAAEGGWRLRRAAPLLGEHNREALAGLLGLSGSEITLLRETGAI